MDQLESKAEQDKTLLKLELVGLQTKIKLKDEEIRLVKDNQKWFDQRIEKLQSENWELIRANEELLEELKPLREQPEKAPGPTEEEKE